MALPWKGTPRYPESISRTTTAWRRYDTCGGTRARPLTGCFKTIRIPRAGGSVLTGASEWVYRQAVSRLLRQLRLPYRFDMEFRSNLEQGTTAVAFTTAGPSMMPGKPL